MKSTLRYFYNKNWLSKILTTVLAFLLLIVLLVSFLYLVGIKAYPENSLSQSDSKTFGFDQSTHVAGYGANAARVDSQITLTVPEDQVEKLYQYLRETYIDHNDLMKERFPSLDIRGENKIDISEFTDEYYDTTNLDLDKSSNSARYRTRVNTTNLNDPKSGRELVQVKATPPGQFDYRTELKFKVENKIVSQKNMTRDDTTQLLKLVNNNERGDFKKALEIVGVDPYSLRKIFTIKQKRGRVYVDWNSKNFLSFSVDQGGANKSFATGKFSSVDIGLVEDVYTPASTGERDKMWEIRDYMVEDLIKKFPNLHQTESSKYSIVLDQIRQRIPYFDLAIKYNLI